MNKIGTDRIYEPEIKDRAMKQPTGPKPPHLLSSREFVAGFTPPDFLVDGLLQKRFFYSLTGPTGSGKTAVALLIAARVALGQPVAGREVAKGRVVYFAGENSEDVRMRWIAMAEVMGFDIDQIDVHFFDGIFSIDAFQEAVVAKVKSLGGCSLVTVDTSAAYFEGDNENDNVQAGNYARKLRGFTRLEGGPCVQALCHPTKNPNLDNLQPRGGGAYMAEVDGGLTIKATDQTVELHWAGKLRGADFNPIHFDLLQTTAVRLKDSKGRSIRTVIAKDLTAPEAEHRLKNVGRLEDQVLLAMDGLEEPSVAAIATKLEWIGATGEPQKSKVHSLIKGLVADGLVIKGRHRQYKLTDKGEKEALKLTKIAVQTAVQASER